MKTGLAVLAGAGLIAAAILFVGRYQLVGPNDQFASLYLLDRWTGEITACSLGGADPAEWQQRLAVGGNEGFKCAFSRGRKPNQ